MGKCPLMPNMLPEKTLEAPLTIATQASVPTKNSNLQLDTSTFTSTVVATNTTRMIKSDDRIRTFGDNLQTGRIILNSSATQKDPGVLMDVNEYLRSDQSLLIVYSHSRGNTKH